MASCRHPAEKREYEEAGVFCTGCQRTLDPLRQSLGRRARARGNGHELKAARLYGGEKVGPLGRAEDIRGATFATQVKTSQRAAPIQWKQVFAKMDAHAIDGLTPRLLLRFLAGPGVPADDYFVMRGRDVLATFGRDE